MSRHTLWLAFKDVMIGAAFFGVVALLVAIFSSKYGASIAIFLLVFGGGAVLVRTIRNFET